MEVTKIVVGIDFSDESTAAAQHAMNIARRTGAEVILVHVGVVLGAQAHPPTEPARELERLAQDQLASDRERLEQLRERISGQGVSVSHMVMDGFPDSGLCEAVESLGAELLIVGTHGRTGFKRFLLGSVAERTVRNSHSATLVARKGNVAGGYKRIVVPTDFSDSAEAALRLALVLAAPEGCIELLHCWTLPPRATSYFGPASIGESVFGPVRAELAEDAQKRCAELVKDHGRDDVELKIHVVEANPAHGIQDLIGGDDANYDLVVMGSHSRHGIQRLLLGSVAERTVRHAPCSVLVVPAPASAAK